MDGTEDDDIWEAAANMRGVGLMVRLVGLGSSDPEFKSHLLLN